VYQAVRAVAPFIARDTVMYPLMEQVRSAVATGAFRNRSA
jgi:histidine ammonia-lyase